MPMKLDAHIENMYSMSSDLRMSTMKSDAGRPPPLACTVGSSGAVCALAGACVASNAAAAPVAAPVRKLRRSTPGLLGSSMRRYPITAVVGCQFVVKTLKSAPTPRQHELEFPLLVIGKSVAAGGQLLLDGFELGCRFSRVQALFQVVEQARVFAAQLANERERLAVDRARPEPADRVLVLGRAVTLVALEAVSGMLARELVHEAIAVDLRDDRRRSDRKIEAVALVEAILRHVDAGDRARVDEHVLRPHRQCFDGAPHREQPRVIDVDGVDLRDLGSADGDRARGRADTPPGFHALLDIELFRIVDAVELRVRREHDRGRDHGAGERAHADLVDAGDVLDAGAPQHALEVQHGVEPRALDAVALVALLERLVDLPHAVSWIALELAQRLRAHGLVRARVALADLVDRQLRKPRRHGAAFQHWGPAS